MKNLKNLKIDEKIHNEIKEHCQDQGIKLGKLIEKLIVEYLKDKSDV
jgi:predicted HicB family RNase H-like nuclease